jgi:hypothetical protein
MAAALCGPNDPPPLVNGGGRGPAVLSCPMLDLPVSLRVKLGANEEEIMFDIFSGRNRMRWIGTARQAEVRLLLRKRSRLESGIGWSQEVCNRSGNLSLTSRDRKLEYQSVAGVSLDFL